MALLGLAVLPACTIVQVEGGELRPHAGFLKLEPTQGAKLVAITSRHYGFGADGLSSSLGYAETRTIIVPDSSRCMLVVFPERHGEETANQLRQLLTEFPDICSQGGEHE